MKPWGWYYFEEKPIVVDGVYAIQSNKAIFYQGKYTTICRDIMFIIKPGFETGLLYQMQFCNDPVLFFYRQDTYTKMIESFKFIK
jgi:hypothetical protein